MKAIWTILASAALLAGCGSGQEGGVTPEEAQALDNAAELLDTSPDSLVPSEDMPLGNGEEPFDAGSGAEAGAEAGTVTNTQ